MPSTEVARKRSVLLSARLRFSPETQPIRQTAIEKIVEQNLLVISTPQEGATIQEIEQQGAVCFAAGAPALSRLDLQACLQRLAKRGRVVSLGTMQPYRYRLSDETLNELWTTQAATEARFDRVVQRLFKSAVPSPAAYRVPFLECLCVIFSQLGEAYVRQIKGELRGDELVRSANVLAAVREAARSGEQLDFEVFRSGVFAFFRDSDPDYDAIKWNMAQNYYVAKVLGLDPSGYLLSKEVFGDSIFYLDTNVIINALEPQAQYHRSFKTLAQACQALGIELKVCQASVNELRGVVESQKEIIGKVAEQIPPDTAPKIRGIFFQLYREQAALGHPVDLDGLFDAFMNPMETLTPNYGAELVDDVWFLDASNQPDTKQRVVAVRQAYQAKRGRLKALRPAEHDALVLGWILRERAEARRHVLLVTLDASLPEFVPRANDGPSPPLAITLDALLQWISPVAIHEDAEGPVAAIFAEAVKYQLLPQDSFFDTRDFLVFAEMEWSCKELPAEDVEECIRHVRSAAPNLDPSDPRDRESIGREIARFFADPGRKFKQEVQRLEGELGRQAEAYEIAVGEWKNKIEERERAFKEAQRVWADRLAALEADREQRVAALEKRLEDREIADAQRALRASAKRRGVAVLVAFLAMEGVAVFGALRLGDGTNWLTKIGNTWWLVASPPGIALVLFELVLGRERIKALGWPFDKLAF